MRSGIFLLISLLLVSPAPAADSVYYDRGKIDFDTAMELLNPYGTWANTEGRWAYTPLDHAAPYQHGRWLYTDYGWYWQGSSPHSWMTEHYGFWKTGAGGFWSWYPAPDWLPQIVELRATPQAIGWRCAEVDATGSFVEEPDARYARPDEWSFVSLANFVHPINPRVIVPARVAATMLDDSTSSMHTYVTYRAIERPGPHPADFVGLARGAGLFPPEWESKPMAPPPKSPAPGSLPAATLMDGSSVSPADARQVSYWVTLNLPTFWSKRPPDAKPNEIYLFRPEIYQDQEGIERRVRLWLNPKAQALEKGNLNDALKSAPKSGPSSIPSASPGTVNPFRSPFDDSFHGEDLRGGASRAGATNAAPDGRGEPAATNAASVPQ